MWQLIRRMLLDQRGEDGIDTGGAPVETGEAAPVDNNGLGTDSGQAGEAPEVPAEPRFGEFGDNPEEAATKLFEAYQRTQGEYNNFKTKAGLTEKNLGTLRKTLESSGIRAVEENGQIRLEAIQKEQRKSRFTDEHKALFDPKVHEAVRLLVQDIFDEQYEGRERMTQEQRQKTQQFMSEKAEVEELMMGHFPMLNGDFKDGKPTNPNFNKAFYDKATEIWETQYGKNPLKQLSAALKAAKELNIMPQMIQAAKKEGVEIGKANKKILAPVGGSGAPSGGGGFRKLSQAEYLALSPDKRIEYDQHSVNQRK